MQKHVVWHSFLFGWFKKRLDICIVILKTIFLP